MSNHGLETSNGSFNKEKDKQTMIKNHAEPDLQMKSKIDNSSTMQNRVRSAKCIMLWSLGIVLSVIILAFIVVFLLLYFYARYMTSDYFTEVPPIYKNNVSANFSGKVLIVGAGAAGISAAYTLEYLGIEYTILEAHSEIGGRVKEIPAGSFADVPLDIGGEWIHTNPKILQDLLLFEDQKVNIDTIEFKPQTWGIVTGNESKRTNKNWIRHFYREHKFYNSTWHSYFKDYMYPYIVDRLELNAVVNSIDYSNSDFVTVTTKDGRSFTGTHAILATPVTVLQDGDIVFNPPLPIAKQQAIDDVYMTAGLKAMIEFDERFYPDIQFDEGLGFVLSEDVMSGPIYYDAVFGKPSKNHVLGVFQVGESAYERTVGLKHDDDMILADIMVTLDELFNNKASKHFVKSYIQNWSAEPFIRGAYSYNDDYDENVILEPLNKRIYFCGEHVAPDDSGSTVHGAALSGRAVVDNLVRDAASEF